MKKIKIIDLLNMISKGEDVPKKIRYKGYIYQYQYKDTREANIINYYYSEETHCHLINGSYHDIRLNDEVEIIEEEKKLPEKIPEDEFEDYTKTAKVYQLYKLTNEIIDYLESKGE